MSGLDRPRATSSAMRASDGVRASQPVLFYEGDPQIIEEVLATLPPEVRGGMWDQAQKAYAAHAERIHGTATPPRSGEV